jgi:hypothetical protein
MRPIKQVKCFADMMHRVGLLNVPRATSNKRR